MKHPLEKFQYCPRCGSDKFTIEGERNRHCKECGLDYYANAAAAVAAIIRNSEGDILLTTRAFNPGKGMLDLPGGFVDMDETAEEALKRELKEELNVEISDPKYLFSIPNEYEYSGITVHTLDMFFEVKLDSKDNIEAHDDVAKAKFYRLENVDINNIGLQSIKKAIKQLKDK